MTEEKCELTGETGVIVQMVLSGLVCLVLLIEYGVERVLMTEPRAFF